PTPFSPGISALLHLKFTELLISQPILLITPRFVLITDSIFLIKSMLAFLPAESDGPHRKPGFPPPQIHRSSNIPRNLLINPSPPAQPPQPPPQTKKTPAQKRVPDSIIQTII